MNWIATSIISAIVGLVAPTSFAGCPKGVLSFAFDSLKVKTAFVVIADYAGLKTSIDQSIDQEAAIKFGCTPWQTAAQNLARQHHLRLKIENGVMYVSR